MRIAITQPNYLPWSGYFDLLRSVELWVVLDNVQLPRRTFIARNRIKSPDDRVRWLSVSLQKQAHGVLLNQALLHPSDWWRAHQNRLRTFYRDAPHAREYMGEICDLLVPRADELTLSVYNRRVVICLCRMLGVRVECVPASSLNVDMSGDAQQNILELCRAAGGTELWNFRKGVDIGLYEAESFRRMGIGLVKQTYQPQPYRQLGATFVQNLSVVDLLLNEGARAQDVIARGGGWEHLARPEASACFGVV